MNLPNIVLPATGNKNIDLSTLKNQPVILYFYPKDDTPGCTQEGQDFKAHFSTFQHLGAIILGVSRDSVKKHEAFKEKYAFPFDLLSDSKEELCNYFGVMKTKIMFGKPARGIDRSTFLFDNKGVLVQEWRGIKKIEQHVEEVLTVLKSLT
ncbi:MAG: hypothetical protein RIT27_260 [Pseudomonadota bacterium]|jgi:peroxiredoxin Q/BCP